MMFSGISIIVLFICNRMEYVNGMRWVFTVSVHDGSSWFVGSVLSEHGAQVASGILQLGSSLFRGKNPTYKRIKNVKGQSV